MKTLEEYNIPFRGMKEGQHNYTFNVNHTFFNNFSESEFKNGDSLVSVKFTNRDTFLEFDITVHGNIETICDRCLDTLTLPIKGDYKLFIKFGDQYEEATDEVVIIPREETEVNIAQYIYEYICLSVPYQRMHPNKNKCNQDTVSKLNTYTSKNKQEEPVDPRWDKLKNLINKNE